MPQRRHYWSCSKLANIIRGRAKPLFATGDEWVQWETEAREAHPVRFWLAESGLTNLQNLINWPLDRIRALRDHIDNRWIERSHALTAHPTHIRPGSWASLDHRILRSMFDSLVDFVEIDLAAFHTALDDKAARTHGRPGTWPVPRSCRWRSRAAGLAYLERESTLVHDETSGLDPQDDLFGTPTDQARDAREIRDIYLWYVDERPKRPDPNDASGWSAYCDDRRERGLGFLQTDPDRDEQDISHRLEVCREIRDRYRQEDTEMLIRLIRVRGALWV